MQDCDPPLRKVQHRRWAHIPSAFCPKVLFRPEFEEVEVKLEDGGITEMRWWRLEFSQLVQHGISPERELWRDKFQKSLWFFFLQTFCHELRYVCIQDPIKYSRKWLMMGREPKANTSSHTMLVKVGYFNQLEQRDLTEFTKHSIKTYIGEGNDNPLQYSCLGNPMDRGGWWAAVHGVTKSRPQLSD